MDPPRIRIVEKVLWACFVEWFVTPRGGFGEEEKSMTKSPKHCAHITTMSKCCVLFCKEVCVCAHTENVTWDLSCEKNVLCVCQSHGGAGCMLWYVCQYQVLSITVWLVCVRGLFCMSECVKWEFHKKHNPENNPPLQIHKLGTDQQTHQ